jgi:hypothetical protein
MSHVWLCNFTLGVSNRDCHLKGGEMEKNMEGIIEINYIVDEQELAKEAKLDEIANDFMADAIRTMEADRKWLGEFYRFVG